MKSKFVIAVLLSVFLVSCSDDKVKNVNLTDQEVKEIVSTNQVMEQMFAFTKRLHDEKKSSNLAQRVSPQQIGIELKDGKIRYDFGVSTEIFGKKYGGVLEVKYEPNGLGYRRILTYKNFIADNLKISGSTTYNVTLRNKQGHLYVSASSDLLVTFNNERVVSRKGNIRFEKVEGNETLLRLNDDVYETSGSWSSVGIDGINREISIVKSLKTKSLSDCLFAVEGTMLVKKGNKKYVIDFGAGGCDAKITVNGREISLL